MDQDWIWGLAGGLMIGLAAALYLLVNGRVMGASGIIGTLADGSETSPGGQREKLAFLAGLILVPPLLIPLYPVVDIHLTQDPLVLVAAGLLVGLGTRLANGCTSGHGVCGISRLAPRGLIATAAYLLAGAVALWALRHGLGWI
jgi:uncharacterized membrane protein YedE/YeeE